MTQRDDWLRFFTNAIAIASDVLVSARNLSLIPEQNVKGLELCYTIRRRTASEKALGVEAVNRTVNPRRYC